MNERQECDARTDACSDQPHFPVTPLKQPVGGTPSIDHSLWFHESIRADEWMLLELWPLKASGSRGVYSGSLRNGDGRLGALLTQEMLLRDRPLDPEMLRRIAQYLGVTPE